MRVTSRLKALRNKARSPHSIPRFEGRESRSHHNVALWRLAAWASADSLRNRRRLTQIETFVQFAGFPRSGHSLIGSILDAHPHARISHELDAMGLFEKGFPQSAIFALIDRMALEFTRHGRYWNGHGYRVPGGAHDSADPLRVIGDKKGDAAVRWIARSPSLIDRLGRAGGPNKKWILVTRDPFDNIATMSLRHGRAYDTLRSSTRGHTDFHRALAQKQREGVIASRVLDSQLDEYERLCRTVGAMKNRTRPADWLDVGHEQLTATPAAEIERIIGFLELAVEPAYVERCAAMVYDKSHRTRDLIDWPDTAIERVEALCATYSFLQPYQAQTPHEL
ncbi:sulfotransferase [Salinisphaera sp. T31B1]|uniref:sulfotransferase n=1 Tax=Salinisphaera sp. T31B1 TaxID=727963 RepID=UPI003342BC25